MESEKADDEALSGRLPVWIANARLRGWGSQSNVGYEMMYRSQSDDRHSRGGGNPIQEFSATDQHGPSRMRRVARIGAIRAYPSRNNS